MSPFLGRTCRHAVDGLGHNDFFANAPASASTSQGYTLSFSSLHASTQSTDLLSYTTLKSYSPPPAKITATPSPTATGSTSTSSATPKSTPATSPTPMGLAPSSNVSLGARPPLSIPRWLRMTGNGMAQLAILPEACSMLSSLGAMDTRRTPPIRH
jgi:hypothetical protein